MIKTKFNSETIASFIPSGASYRAGIFATTMLASVAHGAVVLEGDDGDNVLAGTDPEVNYLVYPRGGADTVDLPLNSTKVSWVFYDGAPVVMNLQTGAHSGDAQGDTYSARPGMYGFNLAAGSEFTGGSGKDVTNMNGSGIVYESGGWDLAQNASLYVFRGAYEDYDISGGGSVYQVYDASGVRKTLQNVAAMEFSDGRFEQGVFTPHFDPPQAAIEQRVFRYSPAAGIEVSESKACYLWEEGISDYPLQGGVECISFENSSYAAHITQPAGGAEVNSQIYSFDPSFAVIGSAAGNVRDFIEVAPGGLVASGGGNDIIYPDAGAHIIGEGNWVTALFRERGSVVDLVEPSNNSGDSVGVTLDKVNAIAFSSGDDALRLSSSHIQDGITFVNGNSGYDELHLVDFEIGVLKTGEVYEILSGSVDPTPYNDQITLTDTQTGARLMLREFERIHVQTQIGEDKYNVVLNNTGGDVSISAEDVTMQYNTEVFFKIASIDRDGLVGAPNPNAVSVKSSNLSETVEFAWTEPSEREDGSCIAGTGIFDPPGEDAVDAYRFYYKGQDETSFNRSFDVRKNVEFFDADCAPVQEIDRCGKYPLDCSYSFELKDLNFD